MSTAAIFTFLLLLCVCASLLVYAIAFWVGRLA